MVKDNKNNRIEQFQQLIKLNNEAASDKEVHAHYRSLVEQGLELKIKCEYSDDDLEETGQINQFNELFFGGEKVSEWYCYWSYDHERSLRQRRLINQGQSLISAL